jgi:tetratricopeptide (TPR) repeat protein
MARRPMFRHFAVAALVGNLLIPCVSWAEQPPTLWDRTADATAARRWSLHRAATQALMLSQDDPRDLLVRPTAIETARAALRADTDALAADPRLSFDLGALEEDRGDHEAAVTILEGALARAPNHPAADDAWITLAYAHSKLDHPERERDCYEEFLKRSIDASSRATARLNHAESEMRLGRLPEAIDGYRAAFAEAQGAAPNGSSDTATLAVWGLVVALDRNGDPVASDHEADLALKLDPEMELIGRSPHVFFVPAYERNWYLGLGFMHVARTGADRAARAKAAFAAKGQFEAYVRGANAASRRVATTSKTGEADPRAGWTPLAASHVQTAQRLFEALGGAKSLVVSSVKEGRD